jgi:glycosyltransferase involved in cell wall biosynthesis
LRTVGRRPGAETSEPGPRRSDGEELSNASSDSRDRSSLPVVVAMVLREQGTTGVQTHVRQFLQYLEQRGIPCTLVTPFSSSRDFVLPIFGVRLALRQCSKAASVVWYRYWHELFLRSALRRRLSELGECVVYAQEPLAARAALRARRGPNQQVAMAVHFRISQADEWANRHQIRRNGVVYRAIRRTERETIPRVDRLVYVSTWARQALVGWLPEAEALPSAVIDNFVAPFDEETEPEAQGDLVTVGNLEPVKNHRFLLRVLAEMKRKGRRISLDIFGDGPLRSELLSLTHTLGLDGLVRFHGFRPDVRRFLPGFRAYVHASYSESSSLAIIEAMAAGLPIVAGNIGPIAELCDEGQEALFWPLDDPVQAATTLLQLLDSETLRRKAATAARDRFHRDFDASIVAPRLLRFVQGSDASRSWVERSWPSDTARDAC